MKGETSSFLAYIWEMADICFAAHPVESLTMYWFMWFSHFA